MVSKEAIHLWLLLMSLEDNVLVQKRWQGFGDFVGLLTDWINVKLIDWISRTLSIIRDIVCDSTISLVHERFSWTNQIAINGLIIRWKRFSHCSTKRQHRIHLGIVYIGISQIRFNKISAKIKNKKSNPSQKKIKTEINQGNPIMKKPVRERYRRLLYLFVIKFEENRFICRASTAIKVGVPLLSCDFLHYFVLNFHREREKERQSTKYKWATRGAGWSFYIYLGVGFRLWFREGKSKTSRERNPFY